MQSKTVKNKVLFNKVIKALNNYNMLNNLRDLAYNNGEDKEFKKLDNKCLKAFDKYLDLLNELPKYEQTRIEKSDLYLIG
jgi:hypothetical protein